jgi:hypothetical protein
VRWEALLCDASQTFWKLSTSIVKSKMDHFKV